MPACECALCMFLCVHTCVCIWLCCIVHIVQVYVCVHIYMCADLQTEVSVKVCLSMMMERKGSLSFNIVLLGH